MTTSNHALAGTLIALAVKEPAAAIPMAFASHFLLDSIPHYGHPGIGYKELIKQRRTFIFEGIGLLGLVFLIASGAWGWNLALLCAVMACLPDLEWPIWYVLYERRGKPVPRNPWTNFHKRIQLEYHGGVYVEIAIFAAGFALLLRMLTPA